ncbi:hypothetical protein NDU88_006531 [Pleurodeles waltl]|uniref:Uncharacterized protein n=1 Tax=Pleurodeles waltl TaxID=8319 RepID=A0AAV7SPY1_PLEWA|nr:hypothetical protein NDU88_006531 [Pleurodeles waltl]
MSMRLDCQYGIHLLARQPHSTGTTNYYALPSLRFMARHRPASSEHPHHPPHAWQVHSASLTSIMRWFSLFYGSALWLSDLQVPCPPSVVPLFRAQVTRHVTPVGANPRPMRTAGSHTTTVGSCQQCLSPCPLRASSAVSPHAAARHRPGPLRSTAAPSAGPPSSPPRGSLQVCPSDDLSSTAAESLHRERRPHRRPVQGPPPPRSRPAQATP